MRRHRGAVLVVALGFAVHPEFDAIIVPAGFQKNAVQIAAMNDRIGILEAGAESLAKVDMGDFVSAQRIHQPQLIDINGHAARGFADAEIVEGMKRIRPQLNAGADFAERRSLFEHDGPEALWREAERRREAADAAADDQDRLCRHFRMQSDLRPRSGLRCSTASPPISTLPINRKPQERWEAAMDHAV